MITSQAEEIVQLSSGWSWKQRNLHVTAVLDELQLQSKGNDLTSKWHAATKYPSEVHTELLAGGHIPDPYIGFNEHKVQWIGRVEWLYKCDFDVETSEARDHTLLEFQGLDTVCDVYLNREQILSTDNQFRTYVADLAPSSILPKNVLLLHFKSAADLALSREQQFGRVRAGSTNLGHPSRVYVRKAQYDWRWDWGPELMTTGPYRPVVLSMYSVRITDVHARASVSEALEPSLAVDVAMDGSMDRAKRVSVALFALNESRKIHEDMLTLEVAHPKIVTTKSKILRGDVDLWWPVGYGKQTRYKLVVKLLGESDEILSTEAQLIGFRRVVLVQEPLKEPDIYGTGTSFLFQVNGVRMFMGGSNWIPADNFLTTLDGDRYRQWLTLLKDGGQNMVRLWGGGVYEPDVFYDICDELGILVWQDFQFACGVYPAHDEFVASVKAEAEDNVKRLRRHPSLALFCGNNEDYQMVLQWGGIDALPARKLYEEVFPDVVERLTGPDQPIPYHRGSPYGGKGWDTSDPTICDVHQWDIWGGKERPYQDYDVMGGRFVSEFGMPAMPDMKTIDYWMQGVEPTQRYAQSKIMAQHNRAGAHERRFAIAMNENFRLTSDLETHVYNSQLMQSEAVGYAYRVWRRQWRGKGKEYTSGVLVWQLNDCWPVTSWALIDYFFRPKAAYYTVARELKPITVGITRQVIKNRENDRPRQFYEFGAFQSRDAIIEVWGANRTVTSRDVTLELQFVDLSSNWTLKESRSVTLLPNQTTEILSMTCPGPPSQGSADDVTTSYSVVVGARLTDKVTGDILARYADWPQPYRYLELPDPELRISATGEQVIVDVQRPVKCLVLRADCDNDEEIKWSDNALDVMPGDAQHVIASGLGGRAIKWAFLGSDVVD